MEEVEVEVVMKEVEKVVVEEVVEEEQAACRAPSFSV